MNRGEHGIKPELDPTSSNQRGRRLTWATIPKAGTSRFVCTCASCRQLCGMCVSCVELVILPVQDVQMMHAPAVTSTGAAQVAEPMIVGRAGEEEC
jgi:hypothetical protein